MKSFGMDQNGNVRKEKKAESLFFCVCVPRTRILKNKLFLSEVKTCAKSYNFYAMKSFNDVGTTFREILRR